MKNSRMIKTLRENWFELSMFAVAILCSSFILASVAYYTPEDVGKLYIIENGKWLEVTQHRSN